MPNDGCGPDPFAGIPGLVGTCANGGWIPAPGARGAGTIQLMAVNGVAMYVIAADDGNTYTPANLPSSFQVVGLRVSFAGTFTNDPTAINGLLLVSLSSS